MNQGFINYGSVSKAGQNEFFEGELHFMLPSNERFSGMGVKWRVNGCCQSQRSEIGSQKSGKFGTLGVGQAQGSLT